ncbi:hypothetical protein DK847_04010 [Aestuariivirga litoralis]|uniref:OmpA-like domain-containing protein n=1 Tax=Aestuariivirga litoralis TaxID=2650924 RepID=A0A2W2BPF3_9HYPH|nr:OmpA family protein [Aestuariivirga litoralis]PZF77617.1 hypothetical protein DK847_04010 [Aestuariivirga litoralis]
MTSSHLKASLVALALFSAAGVAFADNQVEGLMPTAQVEANAQEIQSIRQFLAAGKDVAQMKMPRLQQRRQRAEAFRDVQGLPPELDQALQQEVARVAKEIERRQQGASAPEAPAAEAQPQPEPQLEQPPLPPYDPQQAEGQEQAPPVVKRKKPPQQAQPAPQHTPQPEPVTGSAEAAAFLKSIRPAASLGDAELRQQLQQAMRLSQAKSLSPDQRRALREVIREARAELRGKTAQPPEAPAAQQQQPPPAPPADTQQAKPGVDPALEREAQALLADTTDVRSMKRKQLRKRLTDMRDLLASNQLSPQTREALRQKLARERAVLRNEVAVDEGLPPPATTPPATTPPQQQQQGSKGNGSGNTANTTINNTEIRIVLQDRRPPSELDDRELVRRIDVYREVVADDRYDEAQRRMWRRQMEEDRRYLRRQMMEERQQREARLRQGDYQFDYDVRDRWEPDYDVPDDVFAAEVEDDELADVLVAPPRRQVERRYSVEDFERQPQLRDAVARIEIDTVHFGFGEGYLREEEIDKLDRIASVLEKILARHPDEVFLIEGHTDAVGSDQSNLVLSRQRAAAVKEALTTYYVIPPDNLKTVGLGERYLKIPTSQPEAENRRVSLARITPLVGQAD